MSYLKPASAIVAATVISLLSPAANAQDSKQSPAAPDASALAKVKFQAWEIRRAEFSDTVKALRSGDERARASFEKVVRSFEARPFERTPLEAMDLIGSVFVPQVGVEKMLPLIAAQAALGLYDAMRFASPAGQAELLQSEFFLRRPLTLAGADQAAKSRKFLAENPSLAKQLVQQGIRLAEGERTLPLYGADWASVLGRDLSACKPDGSCATTTPVPREEWPKLWEQAVERVTSYYQVDETPAKAAQHENR